MSKYLLGIDIGTTGTKTLLISEDGRQIWRAYCSYAQHMTEPGHCEQNPCDWWNALIETVKNVCTDTVSAADIAALSMSTQGGTIVPVDSSGRPLRNAIVWNDTRCRETREHFLKEIGDDQYIYKITGWHLGNGLPALAIRWIKENEPEVFEKTAKFLSVFDYISWKLTGIAAIDFSNAGINQLCDIQHRKYDLSLLNFAGIRSSQLPELVESGQIVGFLNEGAAQELGLIPGIPLIAGAHDQYACALGAGACKTGDILIGTGTCWVVTAISDKPAFGSGLAQSVAAVSGLWGSLFSISSGGICLDWFRKKIAVGEENRSLPYELINEKVHGRRAAEQGLFFYPFSEVLGTDGSSDKASFVGISLSHDRFDLACAVMEGIAFQLVWVLETFYDQVPRKELILSGGAAKSEVWCQIVADIAGLPLQIPDVVDLTCVGAAILAGVGSGVYKDVKQGCEALKAHSRTIFPNAARSAVYRKLFSEYKRCAQELGYAGRFIPYAVKKGG